MALTSGSDMSAENVSLSPAANAAWALKTTGMELEWVLERPS